MTLASDLEQAPRGQRGRLIHAAVERECDAGAKRGEAFERVAEQSGRTRASVSEAFYRIQRSQAAAGSASQRGRRRGHPPATNATSGARDADRVLASLKEALGDLARMARDNEAELAILRPRAAAFDEIRQMLEGPPAASRNGGGRSRSRAKARA